MKSHLIGAFHGVSNYDAFCGLIQSAVALVPNGQCFAGDNLFTISRNLGFMDDAKLMGSFNVQAETIIEKSLLWRYYVLCWAAQRAMRVEGDMVECACYRGTGARIVADYVDLNSSENSFYLYDLFEEDAINPELTMPGQGAELFEKVKARFAEFPRARVIKGEVPVVLHEQAPEKIAFFHLDLNNVSAEIDALEFFWDRMTPGASLVLDDFGWQGYHQQHTAETAWFAERGYLVLELPTGQGLVIK